MSGRRDMEPVKGGRHTLWTCQVCNDQVAVDSQHGLMRAMIIAGWAIHDGRPICTRCKIHNFGVGVDPEQAGAVAYSVNKKAAPDPVQSDLPW